MTDFYTSDPHFGHREIITHCARPFSTVHEMNQELSARWNQKVDHEDTVYVLGDVTLGRLADARNYLCRLNGHIKILGYPWHHDKKWLREYHKLQLRVKQELCGDYPPGYPLRSASGHWVEILPPMVVLRWPEYPIGTHDRPVTLCHYPTARWDRRHHNSWHLFGHSHGRFAGEGLSMDVGVDATVRYYSTLAYAPLSRDECAQVLLKKEYNFEALKNGAPVDAFSNALTESVR